MKAQIQPKSQFLFHKNLPLQDFSIMTLITLYVSNSKPFPKDAMAGNGNIVSLLKMA